MSREKSVVRLFYSPDMISLNVLICVQILRRKLITFLNVNNSIEATAVLFQEEERITFAPKICKWGLYPLLVYFLLYLEFI